MLDIENISLPAPTNLNKSSLPTEVNHDLKWEVIYLAFCFIQEKQTRTKITASNCFMTN